MGNGNRNQFIEAADDYRNATGISCYFTEIYLNENVNTDNICIFCNLILGPGKSDLCSDIHRYSTYQAERFGGQYIYLCPLSLCHWCSPVISDSIMTGAFIAGPALITPLDEVLISEAMRKLNLPDSQRSRLISSLKMLPSVPPNRIKSLSQLLYALAISLSDKEASDFFADQEAFKQQSRIGEYIHLLKSMEGDKHSDFVYPLDDEKKLLKMVSMGKKEESRSILNSILAKILCMDGTNLDMVKSRILELVVLISRAALEGGADIEQIFGLNFNYLKQIRSFTTYEQLSIWIDRIMQRFISLVFDLNHVKHTDTILRTIKYMRENFFRRISLKDVAEEVGLNPQYFSKIFKKEMNDSFTNYLNRLRIEEAKRLLKTSHINLGDIGFMVGFEDPSYFTKVFKKIAEVSPRTYRYRSGYYPQKPEN